LVLKQEYTLMPESSDLGTQTHQPAVGAPVASRYDGTRGEPQALHGSKVQTAPGVGSIFPEGSVGSGGHGVAPSVL
jgi:hypothetical protein